MHWVPLFDENTSRKVGAFLPEVDRVPGKKKKKKNVGQPLVNTVWTDFWAGLHSSVEVHINVELFFFFYLVGLGSLSLHALGVASELSLYCWIT